MKEPSRSRAYPSIDLREATTVLLRLVEESEFEERDRDSIAQILGYANGSSGVGARKIAALVHFGLLQRHKDRYRPTGLARSIWEACNAKSEEDLRALLGRAFLNPQLFRAIIDTYRHEGGLPRYFAHTLRDFGITDSAKHDVAQIFMASGEYAGILAADGIFLDKRTEASKPVPPATPAVPAEIFPAVAAQTPSETQESDQQVIRISLTGRRFAEMRFPPGLNDDDLVLIKKQIEFLELQVSISRPAPALPFRRLRQAGEPA